MAPLTVLMKNIKFGEVHGVMCAREHQPPTLNFNILKFICWETRTRTRTLTFLNKEI